MPKQITVLALSGILVFVAACGTLEAGSERTATVTIADRVTEDDRTSDQVPEVTATPTPASIPVAARDIEALIESLNDGIGARTVVVFPGDHASTLKGRTQHQVVPLSIGAGSSATTVEAALTIVLPPSGLVDVVIVSRGVTGLAPEVQMALEQRLYRLDDTETFGTLERHPFVVGPEEPTLGSIGAVFEGGVELVAGGALDDLQPGAPLRLALDWRATEPIDDSLVMFAHLVHEDRLVAQRDAVPGNGILPTESWELGEVVRDQLALQLPPELATGTYEVRVGTYESTSGQRRNLLEPNGGSYVVVREFTVTEGDRLAVSSAPTPTDARLAAPTGTPTHAPMPTSASTATVAPSETPAARTTATPTEATETSTPTPEFTDWDVRTWTSSSPDGVWTAQTTAAFPIADGTYVGEDYYTQLAVARGDHTLEWTVVDEWSRWALGYTTPQPLDWSTDGRYLYFTNRPQPDGCALFTNGSDLQRLDLSEGTVTEIVPSVGLVLSLSPDEQTLAYVGYSDRGLVLRDLATAKERSVNMDDSIQGSRGSLVWSPDGMALMLTVAFPQCAPEDQRMHSIVRVDVATLSATTLIAQDTRLLTSTEWPDAGRVVVTDGNGNQWWMDPVTGQVAGKE